MDEKPETDDGYVTLVNAKEENGEIVEVNEHTGMWAWKHPHGDGTLTYTSSRVRSCSIMSISATRPKRKSSTTSRSTQSRVRRSPLSAPRARARTTITNLINRFYDIADGKIRYDGININKIKKADLRRSLGVVLQDVNLFTGTVMENIRYGNPSATDEQCIEAAKLANADGFIRMLPTATTPCSRATARGSRRVSASLYP